VVLLYRKLLGTRLGSRVLVERWRSHSWGKDEVTLSGKWGSSGREGEWLEVALPEGEVVAVTG